MDPPLGGVRLVPRGAYLARGVNHPKGLAAVFTKGNTYYIVVALTALAGILASLGGGWFDGS